MYEEDGIAFDVVPRDPSWKPYRGALPPRLKMRLGRRIAQAREVLDPDSFDDRWDLEALLAIAEDDEPFWIGKESVLEERLGD